MEIYIAICEDRHIDVDAQPCYTLDDAISYCIGFVGRMSDDEVEEEALSRDALDEGWVYSGTYGYEGDSVSVQKRLIL